MMMTTYSTSAHDMHIQFSSVWVVNCVQFAWREFALNLLYYAIPIPGNAINMLISLIVINQLKVCVFDY